VTDGHLTEVTGAEEFQASVVDASNEQPVLVDFWSPHCAPCVQLTPWVESIAAEMRGVARVVKVNSLQNRRLCIELRVMGLPTFLSYVGGKELARLNGADCTEAGIGAFLQEAIAVHRLQETA
jgi:thioredoxin 1